MKHFLYFFGAIFCYFGAMVHALNSNETANKSRLLSDPMSAAVFTLIATSTKEYVTSNDCEYHTCERFKLNIINHFCNVHLRYTFPFYIGTAVEYPAADTIYGGTKNTAGSFYDSSATSGVQRYKININGYIYHIDIFWCIDCGIDITDPTVSHRQQFVDVTSYGLAIQPLDGDNVSETYECFMKKIALEFAGASEYLYPLPSRCLDSDSYRAFEVFEPVGQNRNEVSYDNGDIGLKLRILMAEDSNHITDLDVYPLNGEEKQGQC